MPRRYNVKHYRVKSKYRAKRFVDRYGQYREGVQKSADMVAGVQSYQRNGGK
jgi:hypothetical protein